MSADKPLWMRDEALALSMVTDGKPPQKRQRRRRCNECGLLFEPDELIPDFTEDGRRNGWICHNCY